jgi:glycosyltransferase involved in cell wall biosynthesis
MRIGLLFPTIYASPGLYPDKIFAPRELLTALSNGLVGRGHEVTVFGPPDTETKARVVPTPVDHIIDPLPYFKFRGESPPHRRTTEMEFAKHRFELECIVQAFGALKKGEIDILHVYHDSSLFFSHYIQDFMGENLPVLYTLHDPLPPPDTFEYLEFTRFLHHSYVSISNSFRHSDLKLNFVETVYHGIDLSQYPYNETPGEAMLFLGRLVPEKGLHNAIAAATAAGVKLTVSVNVPKEGEVDTYYESIKSDLQSDCCTVLPVVDKARRMELYRNARALLFPIEWEEPFGIVLIEAMACGTPVIAYNRGSVAEIVRDNVTGFIVDPDDADRPLRGTWKIQSRGVAGIQEAMGLLTTISRQACCKHIEDHFSAEIMTQNYELLYKKVLCK